MAAVIIDIAKSSTAADFIVDRSVEVEGVDATNVSITQNDVTSFGETVTAVRADFPVPGYTTIHIEFAVGSFDTNPATWSVPLETWIRTTPEYQPAAPFTGDVTFP